MFKRIAAGLSAQRDGRWLSDEFGCARSELHGDCRAQNAGAALMVGAFGLLENLTKRRPADVPGPQENEPVWMRHRTIPSC